jgi:hypothetical protein
MRNAEQPGFWTFQTASGLFIAFTALIYGLVPKAVKFHFSYPRDLQKL